MNRRILYAIALVSSSLMVGIIVGRWFMPERYGLLTMALIYLGGLVSGALGVGAAAIWLRGSLPVAARNTSAAWQGRGEPKLWVWRGQIGSSRIRVQFDSLWWGRFEAKTAERLDFDRIAAARPWVPVACLFGAVTLALFGQFTFMDPKDWQRGVYAYALSVVMFILLVGFADRVTETRATPKQAAHWSLQWLTGNRLRLGVILIATMGAVVVAQTAATKAWNVDQSDNIAAWIGVMLLYAAAFVPWLRFGRWLRRPTRVWLDPLGQRLWTHRLEVVLLAGIVAVAFVARYWHLAVIPPIFGGDEGEMGNEALSVLAGEMKNPFVTGWLSHATLFFFLQAFLLRFLGPTVFGLRLLSVLGGTLSVFVSFFLIRRLFSIRLAFITVALLAVYDFHIHFSRLALNNIFDAVFAPLVLWLLYAGLESRRAAYFALAGMAMGLSIYFYHGARLIPVIVVIFSLYLLVVERDTLLGNAANFVWFVLGSLVTAGPLLDYFYSHPDDFMARLTQRGIFQSGWFNAQVASGRAASEVLLEQFRRSFLAFNAIPDPTSWFSTGLPLLDPLSGMLFVFGLVYALMQVGKKNYALMLIWLVTGVFFGSTLLENPPTSPSFVIVVVPALFFVALGLEKLVELAGRLLRPLARVQWQIAALFVALFAAWSLLFYFVEYTPRYAYGGEPNWVARELVTYLQQRKDHYHVYFVAPPYIYLGIGSIKFMMPRLNGEDVVNPIESRSDLTFVHKSNPALFVFVPARADEFPIVQKAYPNGLVRNFDKPDGKPLFTIYEVKTP